MFGAGASGALHQERQAHMLRNGNQGRLASAALKTGMTRMNSSKQPQETSKLSNQAISSHDDSPSPSKQGMYNAFSAFAWNELKSVLREDKEQTMFLLNKSETVPEAFRYNSSPSGPNTNCNIFVSGLEPEENDNVATSVLRCTRYALLETTTSNIDSKDEPNKSTSDGSSEVSTRNTVIPGVHVLNLVLFPCPNYNLPIFGADLVSLPGNKHLIAIDFQPVLLDGLHLPDIFEQSLKEIHSKYALKFPWGGDIPPNAQRFFSPYALWTRIGKYPKPSADKKTENKDKNDGLKDSTTTMLAETHEDAVRIIQSDIQSAFCDYLNLYIDLLKYVQKNCLTVDEETKTLLRKGHHEYLDYRRTNDPARPLLKRLYGEEWSEGLIESILFPHLE